MSPSRLADGVRKGFHVFYLKVGLDIEAELEMVRLSGRPSDRKPRFAWTPTAPGTSTKLCGTWRVWMRYQIDFIEQPVVQDPW